MVVKNTKIRVTWAKFGVTNSNITTNATRKQHGTKNDTLKKRFTSNSFLDNKSYKDVIEETIRK